MSKEEHRPISEEEVVVVTWLLMNAPTNRPIQVPPPDIAGLQVVARCECGCASVDFEVDGQSGQSRPIADAIGTTSEGLEVGLILWGRDDAVTGLEVYELDPGSTKALPAPDMLRPWHAA